MRNNNVSDEVSIKIDKEIVNNNYNKRNEEIINDVECKVDID